MRKILTTAVLLTAIVLATATCKKSSAPIVRQFKGKIVFVACGVSVVDISNTTGAGQGQVWKSSNSVTYNNAAGIGNYCYLGDNNIAQGDSVSFNISTTNVMPGSNCAIPLCLVQNDPIKTIYVTDIQKLIKVD